MTDIRRIDERISVAPQIDPADIAGLAGVGFTTIVNNRPDDEELGQPSGHMIRAAAEAAGLDYVAIPITHAGFSHPQITAMIDVLGNAKGPVFAYCRSGTRSCHLWALARAGMGDAADDLIGKAAAAGYDIAGARPMLDALSPEA